MVDTLVQAAALTLAERGLAETTTNHVAARAGVSVGSLYQYFEHKDALVEAVLERMVDDLIAVVDARMAGLLGAGPEAAATGLLEAVFDFVAADPSRSELIRQWQAVRGLRALVRLEQHMVEVCRQYLLRQGDQLRVHNLPAALFVMVSSSIYTTVHYLSLPRPLLPRDEVIAAQARMIAAYLSAG
jgi:AcrR family transcriptional regulator